MKVWLTALLAGVAAAALVAGIPALAADQTVTAQAGNHWSSTQVNIAPGDKVTWSNPSGIAHNVCVAKPGDVLDPMSAASCTEFRNGNPSATWSAPPANEHTFPTIPADATYTFECQAHPGSMYGTIVVGNGSGTTTTTTMPTGTTTTSTTTTGTGTTPTDTIPTQTQTGTTLTQTTATGDAKVPRFTTAIKRRAGRKTLTLTFGSSEAGRLEATVFRRPPQRRSFARVGTASLKVRSGPNALTVPRNAGGGLRSGAYQVKLALVDAAGNRSPTRLLSFKIA
jgi:plastocyanin